MCACCVHAFAFAHACQKNARLILWSGTRLNGAYTLIVIFEKINDALARGS